MHIQEKDLPINVDNIERLKTLNNNQFNKNGKWYTGTARSTNGIDFSDVKTGIELRVIIEVTYFNNNIEQFIYSFYEYDTDQDISKELEQFKKDIQSYKSWKYI